MDIDKQKKERFILVAVMLIFLLMALPRALFRKRPQRTPPAVQAGAVMPVLPEEDVAASAGQPAQPQQLPPKDPFELPAGLQKRFMMEEAVLGETVAGGEEGDLPHVQIQGIVWGGRSPLVFIGDKVYKIGDKVADAEILDINKNGVCFLYSGKKVWVRLKHKAQ